MRGSVICHLIFFLELIHLELTPFVAASWVAAPLLSTYWAVEAPERTDSTSGKRSLQPNSNQTTHYCLLPASASPLPNNQKGPKKEDQVWTYFSHFGVTKNGTFQHSIQTSPRHPQKATSGTKIRSRKVIFGNFAFFVTVPYYLPDLPTYLPDLLTWPIYLTFLQFRH